MPSVVQFMQLDIDIASLAMLLILCFPFVYLTLRARAGHSAPLRSISTYDAIQRLADEATESGYPAHVALGSSQVGASETPEASMALVVCDQMTRQAANANLPTLTTTSSPTLLAAAQGTHQEAHRAAGYPERYSGNELAFSGPEPLAYAAHTAELLSRRTVQGNILLGHLGVEGLWIAETLAKETGNEQPIPIQVGGTSDPSAAALMHLALDHSIVGEEVYAAGAYLGRASHLGSLATQDLARVVVILSIIVGSVMTTLGYWS